MTIRHVVLILTNIGLPWLDIEKFLISSFYLFTWNIYEHANPPPPPPHTKIRFSAPS